MRSMVAFAGASHSLLTKPVLCLVNSPLEPLASVFNSEIRVNSWTNFCRSLAYDNFYAQFINMVSKYTETVTPIPTTRAML